MRFLLYIGGAKIGIIFLFGKFSMNLNLSATDETVRRACTKPHGCHRRSRTAVIPSMARDPGHRAKMGLTGDSCQPHLSIVKSSEPETKLQYRGVENPYALMRRRIDIEAARSHLDDVIAV